MGEYELPVLKCKKCGHTWVPRKNKPKICPVCKRKNWDS